MACPDSSDGGTTTNTTTTVPPCPSTVLDLPPGVVTGADLRRAYEHARVHGYVIPSFRVASWAACRVVLAAARAHGFSSPVAIRLTYGACRRRHGNRRDDDDARKDERATTTDAIDEAVHWALSIRTLARQYRVAVIVETETRCADKLAAWYEPLRQASEAFFRQNGDPLFSGHFLEFRDGVDDGTEAIALAAQYLGRLSQTRTWLHVKLPRTLSGEMWWYAQRQLLRRSPKFSLAMDTFTWQNMPQMNTRHRAGEAFNTDRSPCLMVVLDHTESRTNAHLPTVHPAWNLEGGTDAAFRSSDWGSVVAIQVPHSIRSLDDDYDDADSDNYDILADENLSIAVPVKDEDSLTTDKDGTVPAAATVITTAMPMGDWIRAQRENEILRCQLIVQNCGCEGRWRIVKETSCRNHFGPARAMSFMSWAGTWLDRPWLSTADSWKGLLVMATVVLLGIAFAGSE